MLHVVVERLEGVGDLVDQRIVEEVVRRPLDLDDADMTFAGDADILEGAAHVVSPRVMMSGDIAPRRGASVEFGRKNNAATRTPAPGHALVIGGGTMGVGIIAMFLGGGWKVDVVSRSAVDPRRPAGATAKALAAMGKPTDTSGLQDLRDPARGRLVDDRRSRSRR